MSSISTPTRAGNRRSLQADFQKECGGEPNRQCSSETVQRLHGTRPFQLVVLCAKLFEGDAVQNESCALCTRAFLSLKSVPKAQTEVRLFVVRKAANRPALWWLQMTCCVRRHPAWQGACARLRNLQFKRRHIASFGKRHIGSINDAVTVDKIIGLWLSFAACDP